MAEIRISTELPVTPEEAFAWLANPENDPSWCGPVAWTELREGEPGAVGATYGFAEGFGSKTAEGTVEIISLDPPSQMVTRTRTPQRDYTVTYELEPTDSGCRLTQVSEPSFRGVPGPLLRLFFPLIRGQLRRQFRALRAALAETGG